MAQQVKNPPPVQEPQELWARSLGMEHPLEEEMAIHSSILAGRIPVGTGAWQAIVLWSRKESDMTEQLRTETESHIIFK